MKKTGTANKYIKVMTLVLGIILVFGVFCVPEVYANQETKDNTIVRVGWYQSDMFQEGTSDDEIKSGYCYDYLQKVADYTSWKYEYVYGSWTELFHMLQNGEIDCLGGVSMTEERMDTMLFPDSAMGTDQYYLYKRNGDNSISSSQLSTFSGKKAGVIRDNQISNFTLEWMKEKNVNLEIVYFDCFEEQEVAFERGEIDLMAQTINNVLRLEGIEIAAKLGEEPFYLAVSRDNPNLLEELNESLNIILAIDPFILQNLQYVNYGTTLINKTLTDEEEKWVSEHPEITVGYLDNYLPYSSSDKNGNPTGLMTDTLNAILESLRLENRISIEYVPYKSFNQMAEALQSGKADLIFPVYGNLWELEQNNLDASSPVVRGSESFVYKGTYDKNRIKKIAVNENNQMQIAYCRKHFPEIEMIFCDSIDECLKAVLAGRADGTILNTLRTELVTRNSEYKSLSFIQLEGDDSRCFGVNEKDTALILILNRGLRIIGASFGMESSYKYMESFYEYSMKDFFTDNISILLPALILTVGAIILLLVISLNRKAAQVREKEANIRKVNALNSELEELRRKADAANAAKTSFLFDMSHDIRTPMNAILGFTGLMENNLDNPGALKQELKKVQESGEYLLTLINNMLEVARIDSGKEEINEGFMDVKNEKFSVIRILEPEIMKKRLTVSEEYNIQHRYVYADAHKIREIIMNLVSNAVKYTPEGGSIHITLDEIPSGKEGYAAYQYVVEDTGIGISPEFQKVIFESFARERNTTESRIAGTGLGMAIVKRLIDLMNGTVEVESKPGKGSRFTVRLMHRIVDNPEIYLKADNSGQTADNPDFTGRRILLAEDNELNAEIAEAILEDFGAEVEHAKDGAECVDMLERREAGYYDLILMDVQMPNMNGYEASRKIREMKDPEKSEIPIIAMTANAFDEDKKNALAAGMDRHLTKPIEISKLTETLREFLK
ncbi:MAG: transporter substrate-binding domain-containing protein [Bacillota bacterium]|nr:transporter substrate-binding domain-containing protein [Bacillota bacterium]